MRQIVFATALALVAWTGVSAQRGRPAGPVMTIETPKGTFAIEFFQADAPKSVAHILDLATHNFYRGQRIHRVETSLVQFGDPTTRDMSRRSWWGRAGSGQPIGVAEFNRHKHVRGAVSLAHTGDARYADSQLFIVKRPMPSLDGKHVVVGQVISGMSVVDRLQVTDLLKNVTITGAGR